MKKSQLLNVNFGPLGAYYQQSHNLDVRDMVAEITNFMK